MQLTITQRDGNSMKHKRRDIQFKILEKNVIFFAPGTSKAVLWQKSTKKTEIEKIQPWSCKSGLFKIKKKERAGRRFLKGESVGRMFLLFLHKQRGVVPWLVWLYRALALLSVALIPLWWLTGWSRIHLHQGPVSRKSRNFTGHFRVSQFPLRSAALMAAGRPCLCSVFVLLFLLLMLGRQSLCGSVLYLMYQYCLWCTLFFHRATTGYIMAFNLQLVRYLRDAILDYLVRTFQTESGTPVLISSRYGSYVRKIVFLLIFGLNWAVWELGNLAVENGLEEIEEHTMAYLCLHSPQASHLRLLSHILGDRNSFSFPI